MTDTADKRPIITDALAVLGRKNFDESLGRDAIHLACMPVVAGEKIYGGNRVGIHEDGRAYHDVDKVTHIGIADPFVGFEQPDKWGDMDNEIAKGERFLLVLFPRTITSLRHVWSHPDVPEPAEMDKRALALAQRFDGMSGSEKWLHEYADNLEVDFDELIEEATNQIEGPGGNLRGGSNLEGVSPSDEFWHHYKVFKGILFMPDKMDDEDFFSCAC